MSATISPPLARDAPARASADPRRALGERLRRIRRQQGLTLAEVEQTSGGVWKAVVVGAYERGDRAVSIDRLAALAEFYGVPISQLLPPGGVPGAGWEPDDRIVLDLVALEADRSPAGAAIARFVRRIQELRGDHNGQVLTMRGHDLDNLAAMGGIERRRLIAELRVRGILVSNA